MNKSENTMAAKVDEEFQKLIEMIKKNRNSERARMKTLLKEH
jgi:hypothetical protein